MSALLTARALADMLDVSVETTLRWARRGEVPAIKLPSGQIRFRAEQVDAWLASRELTPRTPEET